MGIYRKLRMSVTRTHIYIYIYIYMNRARWLTRLGGLAPARPTTCNVTICIVSTSYNPYEHCLPQNSLAIFYSQFFWENIHNCVCFISPLGCMSVKSSCQDERPPLVTSHPAGRVDGQKEKNKERRTTSPWLTCA